MSEFAALGLYPLWAVSTTVLITAFRLGRATPKGLLSLCFSLSLWVTGLILLDTPWARGVADRVLPAGFLLCGSFLHAGVDVTRAEKRGWVRAGYLVSLAVALLGAIAPRLIYSPDARAPGPLFLPIAIGAAPAAAALVLWLGRAALAERGVERWRRAELAAGATLASLGGGGVIALRVFGLGDVWMASPLLLCAILLASHATLGVERGRARDVVRQGLAYAALTAALSSIGLTALFKLMPYLAPHGGRSIPWVMLVVFLAALPLDPARLLVVENAGRRLFKNPIGVRDLADAVEKSEVRADHAERLAEIGKLTSAVAHEIRNPLGVIAAHAKLLERQGADPETIEALRGQIDRAKHFLDDLLRYGKPRPLDITEVEAKPALELAAGNVRRMMGEGDDAREIEVTGPAGLSLDVDRGAFNDVTTVLLHNASIAAARLVRCRLAEAGDAIEVTVEDDGPGVPPAIEATLFQPFVTGRGRDAKHPGTGLGLAIAARWVERHGGSLRHQRPEDGGARFVARWPKVPSPNGLDPAPRPENQRTS